MMQVLYGRVHYSEEHGKFTCLRLSSLGHILHISFDNNWWVKFEICCLMDLHSVFLFGQMLTHERGLSLCPQKHCVLPGQNDSLLIVKQENLHPKVANTQDILLYYTMLYYIIYKYKKKTIFNFFQKDWVSWDSNLVNRVNLEKLVNKDSDQNLKRYCEKYTIKCKGFTSSFANEMDLTSFTLSYIDTLVHSWKDKVVLTELSFLTFCWQHSRPNRLGFQTIFEIHT